MSKRLDVLRAIKAMVEAALPGMDVRGVENDGVVPDRIPPTGRIVIRAGDPGEPEVDLSPLTYNYSHQVPVEIVSSAREDLSLTAEAAVDLIAKEISDAIKADRTLGGAVDFLDGFSPATEDVFVAGAPLARVADLVLVATYATTDPL